jgi:hypothetical protein
VNPGTTSAPSRWDSYLAWDDSESWAPLPEASVEEYMGSLPATQPPPFSWDWNNPAFPTSTSGSHRDASIQHPLPGSLSNPNLFNDPRPPGVRTQLESTSSWSSVPRLSPDSVPSVDSSFPSHQASVERSPPRPNEQSAAAPQMSKGHSSSSSEAGDHTSSTNSREQIVKAGKKRAAPSAEFVKDGPEGSKIAKRSKKVAHNTVEKRYRMNLNSKIAELRESVPSLRSIKTNLSDDEDNGGDNAAPSKGLRKAQVLSKANEYIHELERQARQLRNENEALKKKMALLRTVAASEEPDTSPDSFAPSPSPAVSASHPVQRRSAKGFRPLAMQPVKMQSANRPGKTNTMNKAMMGCLAGLTVFEGMSDHNQAATSNTRGLFAVPIHFLGYLTSTRPLMHLPGMGSVSLSLLAILKVVLLWTTLISMLSPSLFDKTQHSQKSKRQSTTRLHPAPPLASAVEVRQKAWLTSIQTVWVPRRNLILEVAAIALKMIKIFIRSCIGWKGYAAITGFTEADEIARIKAWDIALDSQLTGGDPEICLDRLALTFLASLTLPTAPGRSALKALHIYVLCKGLESKGLGSWFCFHRLVSNLATSFWNKAKDANDSAHPDALPSEPMAESEVLPEYIKVLLEQPAEDIFTDEVKQRGFNLAYNKSTTDGVPFRDEGSEIVVTDFAIRSPLDALAAWWSSKVLRQALIQMIEEPLNEQEIMDDLYLALQSAPPSSGAQLRALTAIAAFQPQNREGIINTVIETMDIRPASSPKSNPILASSSAIAGANSPDIRIALRCAMLSAAISAPRAPASLAPPRLLQVVASILANPDQDVALLGFITAYNTLKTLSKSDKLFDIMQGDIEKLSASLRILVGGDAGRSWDLSGAQVRACVGVCLDACKRAAGIQEDNKKEGCFSDQGYGSGLDVDAEIDVEGEDEDDSEEPVEVEVEVK